MAIGDNNQAFTDQLPGVQEKNLLLAPQTNRDEPAETGFQSLHFLTYNPQRTQSIDASNEYGGSSDGSVDPGDPQFGDAQFSGNLTTRLCLNEILYPLAYLLGAPASSAFQNGHHRHIFTTGDAVLPLATLRDYDQQTDREVMGAAFNSLQMSISDTANIQTCDWTFNQKSQEFVTKPTPAGGDVTPPPARLFIEQSSFEAFINDVSVGFLLDTTINYTSNIQSEKYVDATNDIAGLYVGDPVIGVSGRLRFFDTAQLNAFGGREPFDFKLVAQGPTADSAIRFHWPRLFTPQLNTDVDGTKGVIPFQANGAKTTGESLLPAMTVELVNQISSA